MAPRFEDRIWVGNIFGIEFPDPDKLSDLESSARFYLEKNGEMHLHSDFLLDLYAANAEYSADALEDVYLALEVVGNHMLSKQSGTR